MKNLVLRYDYDTSITKTKYSQLLYEICISGLPKWSEIFVCNC